MDVKIIKTQADYEAAMARLRALLDAGYAPGTRAGDEFDLLALVIEDYERRSVPPPVVDPIDAILFRMEQAGLSRKDLVPMLGSESRVSEVLSRKRPLSLAMIRRLNRDLGIPADILIAGSVEPDHPQPQGPGNAPHPMAA